MALPPIVVNERTRVVSPQQPQIALVVAQGRQGQKGDTLVLSNPAVGEWEAAENISGHKLVSVLDGKAYTASHATADNVVGIATSSTVMGSGAIILRYGLITENTWSFTEGPVFMNNEGGLTQSPSGTVLFQVGTALSSNTLELRLSSPIEIA